MRSNLLIVPSLRAYGTFVIGHLLGAVVRVKVGAMVIGHCKSRKNDQIECLSDLRQTIRPEFGHLKPTNNSLISLFFIGAIDLRLR